MGRVYAIILYAMRYRYSLLYAYFIVGVRGSFGLEVGSTIFSYAIYSLSQSYFRVRASCFMGGRRPRVPYLTE